MLGALIAVAVLFGSLLLANIQPLLIALNGKLKVADDLGYFRIGWQRQLWVLACVAMMIAGPLLLQRSLTRIETDYDTTKQRALEAKAAVDGLSERMDAAFKSSLEEYNKIVCDLGVRLYNGQVKCSLQHQINELRRRLQNPEEFILDSGQVAVMGAGTGQIGSLKTATREIYVFDPKTAEETFVVIVHIFDGLAYWEYGETTLFVELDDKSDINLWRQLKTDTALRTFGQFDLIVGLGLESNTGEIDNGYSALRAKTLCTNLSGVFENRLDAEVAGLDIGMYRGDKRETKDQRNPRLRPVILVGVNAKEHADYDAFLQELLSKVRVPELELDQFENLMEGHKPNWYFPPQCRPRYDFVEPSAH